MCANSARHRRIAHEAQIACHARRELLLRSLLILHSQLVSTHRGPGQSPDLKCSANTARCSKHGAQRSRETQTNNCGASPTRRTCPAARRRTCWHWCFGEEDLHATDVGGMSNASAIGVRGLCDRGACRVRRPPDPARARGGRAAPWLAPAGLSSRRNWGLADRGRSRSAARKTYHAHGLRTRRAMRRESRAVDAPCRRKWFSRRQLRRTGARLSGRAHRPDDDAVPPMEDIEDDRSEVLAAAEVDRDGLQPLAHAASAAAKTTRTNRVFVTE